jgi:hypothetical protein
MNRHAAIHEIAAMIAELPLGHPVRVAVDGRDGAGKTMLADELVQPLQNIGRPVIRASIAGAIRPQDTFWIRTTMRRSASRCCTLLGRPDRAAIGRLFSTTEQIHQLSHRLSMRPTMQSASWMEFFCTGPSLSNIGISGSLWK